VVRSLHRDLGTRLAADGAPAWRVAHHLSLGAAEGDMLAVDWLHRAGLEAAPRDPFAAVALLERAVDLVPPNAPEATSVGDQIAQATCHLGLTVADANAGRLETASAHGAAAVRLAESVQTPQLLMVNAHVSYAWTLEEQDLLGDALATVDRLSAAVGEREEAPTTAQIERWRARAHYAAGRWDDAMVDLDSALLVNASGIDVWPEPLALRALIRVHRGEVDVAQEDLDRFEALVAAGAPVLVLDQPMLARAFLMESGGNEAQALELLTGAWQIAEAVPLAMALPALGPLLARLAVQADQPDRARRLLPALDRLASANANVPRLRAAHRWATGLADGDCDVLLDAVTIQERAARPFELAMLREDAAALLARGGRTSAATELLHQALACYADLGARRRSAHARARLRAFGVHVGTSGKRGRPRSGWAALTPAELQVVQLAAERHSNPEIA
jgi:tetratricopeptide (TPR) repeat protein